MTNRQDKDQVQGRWVQPQPVNIHPGPGVRAVAVNWNYRPSPVFVDNFQKKYADLME